jgi:hypothetical protein
VSGQSLNKGFKFGTGVGDQWRLDERPDPLMGFVPLPIPKSPQFSSIQQAENMVFIEEILSCFINTWPEEKRVPMLFALGRD